jgi:uncharacterized protein YndB with AHSA1/START domain
MTATDLNAVRKSITVRAPQATAFRVFTEGMATWWPLETHHIGKAAPKAVAIEPRVGGRCYERGVDGSECVWGHVMVWEPPARYVFSWEISADFQVDPNLKTEVEVRFIAETAERTRVELEHRLLDRFGERRDEMRNSFDSPGGWTGLLELFAKRAEKEAA